MREDIGDLKATIFSSQDETQAPVLSIVFQSVRFGKDSSPQQNKDSVHRQCHRAHPPSAWGQGGRSLPRRQGEVPDSGWHRWAPHHQTRRVRNPQLLLPQSFQGRERRNHAPHYPKQGLTASHSHTSSYQHVVASHQELNVEWTRDGKGICNLFCSRFYLLKKKCLYNKEINSTK